MRDATLSHHATGRGRRAVFGVLWSTLNAFLPAASGLVVFMAASRVLDPAQFGLVAFAGVLVAAVGAFSPAGFGEAVVQRVDLTRAHLNATFWLCLGWGAALYAIVALLAGVLAQWFDAPPLRILLPVLGLKLVFDLAGVIPSALLARRMEFRRIALRTMIVSVLTMITCLIILQAGYGLWALVMSQLIGSAVTCLVGWASVSWRPDARLDVPALRELTGFGGYASVSQMVNTINIEQILVGSLMGTTAVGLYAFARRVFQIINDLLSGALSSVSFPLLSSLQNDGPKLREAYLASTFLSSAVAFPAFTGLFLIAPDMIPMLFGPQWLPAVPALQALCAIGLLSCIGVLQSALIRARGHANWWMWYLGAKQVLAAVVVVCAAPNGITTVVLCIALMTWLVWPVMAILTARVVGLSPWRYLSTFIIPAAGCAVMALAVLGLQPDHATPVTLGLQIAAGAAAYGAVVTVLARRRLRAVVNLIRRKT